MPPTCTVRRFEPAEWRTCMSLRLRALADAPDAFGSTLALEAQRAPGAWESRLAEGVASPADLPLLALCAAHPAGLSWAKVDASDPALVHLFQVWVAPEFRGRGLGRLLLDAAVAWARGRGASALHLGVTIGDTPAMRLYRSAGFQPHGPAEPLRPGAMVLAQPMRLRFDEQPS